MTCAKSNHDRHRTHLGPIFLVLLKRSFDGVLGAPLRTTVLKIGVPRGINLPWKDHPPAGRGPGSSENMAPRTIWRESDGSHILPNHAPSRLEPIVIRFSTSDTYPTKNRKYAKKANHDGGASFVFGPLNRYVPLVKGPKKAVSGGKMVDLGGRKRKTPHLRDCFLPFFGFS